MSKTKLKKYLSTLPQEQLVQVILDLYDARKEAKEYLEFFMNPDQKSALEKEKKDLYRIYFTPQGKTRSRVSVKSGSDLVADFIRLDIDPELVADLMLYHVEVAMSRLVMRHIVRETAWNSIVTLFRKAIDYIVAYDLRGMSARRIEKILEYTAHTPPYLNIEFRLREELNECSYYEK